MSPLYTTLSIGSDGEMFQAYEQRVVNRTKKKLCLLNKFLYRITPAREHVALVLGQYVKIEPAK